MVDLLQTLTPLGATAIDLSRESRALSQSNTHARNTSSVPGSGRAPGQPGTCHLSEVGDLVALPSWSNAGEVDMMCQT